ncbi:MAG: IS66 family insertion sequence element accessory protein TnpB [Bacteroidota bacterium]|nr:IS66 family insertion sequence element accessory protein TnpB [Bacteroidota bacterium]
MWDRNGFLLCYKRLEEGTFELPPDAEPTWAQMTMMLEGVSLESVKYRRRFALEGKSV